MTEIVPEPEPRGAGSDVERPMAHEGDTEDTGAARQGESVEGAERAPEW
jgi:hypothetical protein